MSCRRHLDGQIGQEGCLARAAGSDYQAMAQEVLRLEIHRDFGASFVDASSYGYAAL
jgi:hypothetical protein